MCRLQPSEDDSLPDADYSQSTGNGLGHVDTRLETQIAMLAARIANVEVRVERLEARMFYLQKAVRVLFALFLFTLLYAIWK